jgi:hypothetical protein
MTIDLITIDLITIRPDNDRRFGENPEHSPSLCAHPAKLQMTERFYVTEVTCRWEGASLTIVTSWIYAFW